MLVLTRKVGERIHIGDGIVVTVVRIQNDKVRIGVEAPTDVAIHREEVYRRVHAAQTASPISAGVSEASVQVSETIG
jgi:carbon storage regulator